MRNTPVQKVIQYQRHLDKAYRAGFEATEEGLSRYIESIRRKRQRERPASAPSAPMLCYSPLASTQIIPDPRIAGLTIGINADTATGQLILTKMRMAQESQRSEFLANVAHVARAMV